TDEHPRSGRRCHALGFVAAAVEPDLPEEVWIVEAGLWAAEQERPAACGELRADHDRVARMPLDADRDPEHTPEAAEEALLPAEGGGGPPDARRVTPHEVQLRRREALARVRIRGGGPGNRHGGSGLVDPADVVEDAASLGLGEAVEEIEEQVRVQHLVPSARAEDLELQHGDGCRIRRLPGLWGLREELEG